MVLGWPLYRFSVKFPIRALAGDKSCIGHTYIISNKLYFIGISLHFLDLDFTDEVCLEEGETAFTWGTQWRPLRSVCILADLEV